LVGFGAELPAAGGSEGVELGGASGGRFFPLATNESFVLELVERGIERAVGDLEGLVGHLAEALRDGPAGAGLEIEDLEDEEVERALEESGGAAHGVLLSGKRHVSVI
jgi:hypothetical protein